MSAAAWLARLPKGHAGFTLGIATCFLVHHNNIRGQIFPRNKQIKENTSVIGNQQ